MLRDLQAVDPNIIRFVAADGEHVLITELQRHLPWPLRTMTPLASPFFNSAAKGAWPTLQAATGAHVQGGDYLGPQGLGEVTGRSGPAPAART